MYNSDFECKRQYLPRRGCLRLLEGEVQGPPKLEIYISDYLQKSATEEDLEAPFYLLKYTYAAAVLTENGLMDSEVSLAFLESDEGKNAIIALRVDGGFSHRRFF